MSLTVRQREILAFMHRFADDHGYPPTVREIGRAVGLTSTSTVHAHLRNLETSGHVKRDPTKPRAIEVIEKRRRPRGGSGGQILPLLGRVAAGTPILAEELVEDEVAVPHLLAAGEGAFVLAVHGDSMIDAGILDGDWVVVEPTAEAHDGEIVVALIDDESTVKRFFREDGFVRLQPENATMAPILVRDVSIVGRVSGVLRRM